jgi:protein disulfide-isomerase A6
LKYFDGKSDTPIDYDSKRDLESLQTFIKEQSGTKAKVKKELPSDVVVLSDSNFNDVVNGDKNVLVEFYAVCTQPPIYCTVTDIAKPWCGHCKALAPVYETLAHTFAGEEDVTIANLDADAANGKETARKFDVTGFPTLKFFPKGSTEPIPYEGSRTEAAFVKFLNEHAGTARTVGGGLSELGGRIAAFDEELEALIKGDANSLKAVTKKIEKLAKASKDTYAAYYVKVLGKLKGGEGYVEKELERLKKILSKGGLVGKKQDELTAKTNILAQFYAEKISTKDEL